MGPSTLQFGITIRAWSLVFAAEAFLTSTNSLKAIDLILLRCRRDTLRVHPPRHEQDRSATLGSRKSGIAGIPLELLLSLREAVIDLALNDAKQKHIGYIRAEHERHVCASRDPPFNHCLHSAIHGQLENLCASCRKYVTVGSREYKAIHKLLSKYSLSLASNSPSIPLLVSPPYFPREPYPWVVALMTHHSRPTSRSPSFLPVYTPLEQGSPPSSTEISFFSPSFMRITSSDIMRFRNLVRTWHIAVVELSGSMASRGSEYIASSGYNRSSFMKQKIPGGALIDMEVMDRLSTMGHCAPRWMLLSQNNGSTID